MIYAVAASFHGGLNLLGWVLPISLNFRLTINEAIDLGFQIFCTLYFILRFIILSECFVDFICNTMSLRFGNLEIFQTQTLLRALKNTVFATNYKSI